MPQLASYLHLPVQSGSDRILAAMKRGHTALEYKAEDPQAARGRPDISISSDFIVGFPGETDADFEATMKLIEDVGFDQSFSFIYSAAPGHARRPTCPTTPPRRKSTRACSACRPRSTSNAAAISRGDGRHRAAGAGGEDPSTRDPSEFTGRTENMRYVNFAGHPRLVGQFVDVLITEATATRCAANGRTGAKPTRSAIADADHD